MVQEVLFHFGARYLFIWSHVKLRGCIEKYSLHLAGISLTGYQLCTSVTGDKKKTRWEPEWQVEREGLRKLLRLLTCSDFPAVAVRAIFIGAGAVLDSNWQKMLGKSNVQYILFLYINKWLFCFPWTSYIINKTIDLPSFSAPERTSKTYFNI